jgi:hypothetical protein
MTSDAVWDFVLLFACLGGLLGLVLWWAWHSKRRDGRQHASSLTALAGRLGGTVSGPDAAHAWSAALQAPFEHSTDGLVDKLSMVTRPRFDAALDFRRGAWPVRVSEASMESSASGTTRTRYEHRIEVATAQLPPMRISPIIRTDFRGRPLPPDKIMAQGGPAVREAPVTVQRQRGDWQPARMPPVAGERLVAFTSDQRFAAHVLTPPAAEWLAEGGRLPFLLTFEGGLLYYTVPGRIDPDRILHEVDLLVGFLDRTPLQPGHPAPQTPASGPAGPASPAGPGWRRHLTGARIVQLVSVALIVVVVVLTTVFM